MNIIVHESNGLQIGQRREDGYINLTQMAQANNKDLYDYLRLKTTKEFLKELSIETGISGSIIIQIYKGRGDRIKQGTWGHPQVAIHCGQWCSAKFAVLVSKWVFGWLKDANNPNNQVIGYSKELLPVAKAYVESSQALNRTIHTAIHQQTDSLREVLKFLESSGNSTVVTTEPQPEYVRQTPNITNTIALVISQIKLPPSQPRRYFDPTKLEELSRSIKQFGILEPLLVRPLTDGDYELVAGERRLRAAQLAGLTQVPAHVHEMDDITTAQVRLIENLQREDLNPLEETEGILELLSIQLEQSRTEVVSLLYRMQNLAKGNVNQNVLGNNEILIAQDVFDSLGTISWSSFVSSRLPLLKLPPDVLSVLQQGKIEYTKARAVARVKDEDKRQELLQSAISENLSLTQINERIQATLISVPASNSLKERYKQAIPKLQKAHVWDNPKKQKTLEKLLAQIEALIEE